VYRVVPIHVTWPTLYAMSLVSADVGIAAGRWLADSSDVQQLQGRAAASIVRAAERLQSP